MRSFTVSKPLHCMQPFTAIPGVFAILLAFGIFPAQTMLPEEAMPVNDVFVVATLYSRHNTTPVYNLDVLSQVVKGIAPDVVVLDVNPTELQQQKVYPGKVEYTQVIFPWLNARKCRAYAGEPGEPEYTEIVEATRQAHKAFETDKAVAFAAWSKYKEGTFEALRASWQSAADVNSETTDKVLAGKLALQGKLVGSVDASGWERWNQYTAGVVLQAVRENPGKRILLLTGLDNCYAIRSILRTHDTINLVNMEQWLKDH